jgi:signal transduction histidine kinase/ligand-binding sensor domain-containing protein
MQKKLLLIACFFICTAGVAQQYPFVQYTPKDGLVNSRVKKAYQDSKGRMYFITFGGLSVYDGARFKNYTLQNGLLSELVNDVLEVGDDSLLVAVNTSGLNVLVRGQMKKVIIASGTCPVINQLLKSNDGNIYASTDDGLYRFRSGHLEKLTLSFPGKKIIDFLGPLAEYRDFIVFNTNDMRSYTGLFLYSKKAGKITDALEKLPVLSLATDYAGMIWVGTREAILNLDTIALCAGKLELRKPYNVIINEDSAARGSIHFNRQNELFVAAGKKGIIRYNKDGTAFHITSPDFSKTMVENFFIDRENVLWVCHDGDGVYKLSNTKLQSTDMFSRENKSGIRVAWPFSPDSLWLVMNNGQWILHTLSKRKTFRATPSTILYPLLYNRAHWYATDLHSLFKAVLPKDNESSLQFKKIFTLPDTTSFGGSAITDPFGNIIIFAARTICVFQNDKLISTYPFSEYDLVEGMYVSKRGQLWMVSRSGLIVFSFHPEDPLHYLQKEFQSTIEFGNGSPRCMVIDKNETLWIGTRYHGLMAFEYKNERLQKRYRFQTQNGLTDNFVTSLTCDRNDNILVGTQTGVDRLIKTRSGAYRLENITKSSNIFSFINVLWTNAAGNSFAFTNSGNVFQIEPVLSPENLTEPKLLVEEMKVNGKFVLLTSAPLRLKYYQRNISFSVAAPSFIDEKQVQYSYLLSGIGNNEWSDTSSLADINLLNLSPGNYTLRVKAFFSSTSYLPKEMELSFQIMPPWWQTILFRLIAASMITGLLIAGTRFYYRRKLEQQRVVLEKQQAIEKERTRIATDMHDDLGAGLSRIKFLSETIGLKKQMQQPIEEDISKIREYSHEMIDKMGEIVWALNEKNDSLSDLLSYTRSYAAEYLSQNGINCVVNLPDHLPSVFVSGEFRRNIFLAVKEILHNVVKHSQANNVTISIHIDHDLALSIKDDGTGFEPANIRPYNNGLPNIEKRMKDMNGKMEIQSTEGTTVYLRAPLLE